MSKRVVGFILLSALACASLAAQASSATVMPQAQLRFYRYLFRLTAYPLDDQATRTRRIHQVALQFGMNQSEEAALTSVATTSYSTSVAVHQKVTALLAGRLVSSPADQATLAALDAQQTQSIQQWASILERSLRTEIVARFKRVWTSGPAATN